MLVEAVAVCAQLARQLVLLRSCRRICLVCIRVVLKRCVLGKVIFRKDLTKLLVWWCGGVVVGGHGGGSGRGGNVVPGAVWWWDGVAGVC